MQQHHDDDIGEKPLESEAPCRKPGFRFIAVTGRDQSQDAGPGESHKNSSGRMHAAGIAEHVKNDAEEKAEEQHQPLRRFNGKQQDKEDVDVRIDIPVPLHMVQHPYLDQDEEKETEAVLQYFNDHCSAPIPVGVVLL